MKKKIFNPKHLFFFLCLWVGSFSSCREGSDEWPPIGTETELNLSVELFPRCFEHNIYPSYVYMAPFYATMQPAKDAWRAQHITNKIFSLSLVSPRKGAEVTVKFHESSINEESTERFTTPLRGDTLVMRPNVRWKYDALRQVKSTSNISMVWTVTVDGKEMTLHKTFSCCSINQCVYSLSFEPNELTRPDNQATTINFYEMFVGYIEEENPLIENILRQGGTVDLAQGGFLGFQWGKEYAFRQWEAIWFLLQQRGVQYSNIAIIPGPPPRLEVQNVRFISEVYDQALGNCVDGTCSLASILYRAGFEVFMIFTPDHMYLGMANQEGVLTYFIETTMLNEVRLDQYPTRPAQIQASRKSLKAAMDWGAKLYRQDSMKYVNGVPLYNIISLSQARRYIPSINYGNGR